MPVDASGRRTGRSSEDRQVTCVGRTSTSIGEHDERTAPPSRTRGPDPPSQFTLDGVPACSLAPHGAADRSRSKQRLGERLDVLLAPHALRFQPACLLDSFRTGHVVHHRTPGHPPGRRYQRRDPPAHGELRLALPGRSRRLHDRRPGCAPRLLRPAQRSRRDRQLHWGVRSHNLPGGQRRGCQRRAIHVPAGAKPGNNGTPTWS